MGQGSVAEGRAAEGRMVGVVTEHNVAKRIVAVQRGGKQSWSAAWSNAASWQRQQHWAEDTHCDIAGVVARRSATWRSAVWWSVM